MSFGDMSIVAAVWLAFGLNSLVVLRLGKLEDLPICLAEEPCRLAVDARWTLACFDFIVSSSSLMAVD